MKKILIITYSYYPLNSPHAFRFKELAEYWKANGYYVDIVCAWKPNLCKKECIKGVNIHRVGGSLSERLRNTSNANIPTTSKIKDKKFNVKLYKRILKLVYDFTWKRLYWPDYAILWYKPAVKKCKELMIKNNYDNVITVSIPFTSHLIGLKLKKIFQFNWIVDYGDPFSLLESTPPNNFKLYKKANFRIENIVNKYSDKIIMTPELKKEYYQKFPENSKKITEIPILVTNSFKNKMNDEEKLEILDKSHINLVFVGTLYKNIRNPEYLIKVIESVSKLNKKVKLHFVGNISDCKYIFENNKDKLGKEIFLHGIVEKNISELYIKQADFVVNIGNKNVLQLPSKVAEYAVFDKMIINVSSIENDPSVNFFKNYKKHINIFEKDDIEISSKKILEFIENRYINDFNDENFRYIFSVQNISKYYFS